MKLNIRNVGLKDFGSYKCVAQNSLGGTDGVIKLDGKFLIYRILMYVTCMEGLFYLQLEANLFINI
jgi:hypothetical protein